MCGIVGSLNRPFDDPGLLLRDLHHRGPDGHGSLTMGPLTVLHTRLAIQDQGAGGHQPMQRGRYVLVFNGEIYNHLDLRRCYNLICQSGSDTETLLALWEQLGPAALLQLDGMFAFALFDSVEQRLWLARDRFGQKPLYVWQTGTQLVFCSELRTLQRHLPLQPNRAALSRFCQAGYLMSSETPYRHVRLVQPGHLEQIDARTMACTETDWRKSSLPQRTPIGPQSATLNRLEQTLTQTVRQHLDTTDREVGVLLSGGVDSGLITALATQYQPGIRTFTLSFGGGSYDEGPLARLVANRYQTRHTEVIINTTNLADEVLDLLPRYGEPFMDSSALPSFWVARAARQHLPVVLTGDGADELFGGYRRYVPARLGLYDLPAPVARLLGKLSTALPHPKQKQSRFSQALRLLASMQQTGPSRYLSTTSDVMTGYESALIDPAPPNQLTSLLAETDSLSNLQQLQALDRALLLPGDLLKKMDIATMAHGLEARNPFLSQPVADFALSLPDNQKIGWQNGAIRTKVLLRQLAHRYLPPVLVNKPKRGFEVPLRQWLDGPLRALTHDFLTNPGLIDTLIEPSFIRQLLEQPRRFAPEKRAKLLWMMLSVEIWHRSLRQHD